MSDYLIDGEILGDIADAIREKTNSTDTITPENMASEIASITGSNKITDLTDTSWVLKTNPTVIGTRTPGVYNEMLWQYHINFISNGTSYTTFEDWSYANGYAYGLAYDDTKVFSKINDASQSSSWTNEAYRTISITGGTDAQNTDLIDYLCANGELQEKEYQTKIDESLETESKEIVGAINEVNEKTVDKVSIINTAIQTYAYYHEMDEGITYALPYGMSNSEGGDISYGNMYLRVPIVEGKNVKFELEDNHVKINATGGNSFEMPQIRFTGARYTNTGKIVDTDNPLTLSVEIVGGGALQEGDKLQICVRRTYGYKRNDMPYRKQKLRAVCTYDITNEDIDKRFLSINTNRVNSWLFYNDRNSTINGEIDTQSAFYLRIKRVTKYQGDGNECDAIFSNIVTVWKTYNRHTHEVNIK